MSALRFHAQGRSFGYSADTAFDPSLLEWLGATELFCHETNLGVHTPLPSLLSRPEAERARMRLIHYPDFVVHVESPVQRTFTLGDFFAIWGQPLSPTRVGPASGSVNAFVDGAPFSGDPATIALAAHAVIQLDVGEPRVAPPPFSWPAGY